MSMLKRFQQEKGKVGNCEMFLVYKKSLGSNERVLVVFKYMEGVNGTHHRREEFGEKILWY